MTTPSEEHEADHNRFCSELEDLLQETNATTNLSVMCIADELLRISATIFMRKGETKEKYLEQCAKEYDEAYECAHTHDHSDEEPTSAG